MAEYLESNPEEQIPYAAASLVHGVLGLSSQNNALGFYSFEPAKDEVLLIPHIPSRNPSYSLL